MFGHDYRILGATHIIDTTDTPWKQSPWVEARASPTRGGPDQRTHLRVTSTLSPEIPTANFVFDFLLNIET